MTVTLNFDLFSTLIGVSALIVFLAQWANNSWALTGWAARIRTWVIGALLALAGMRLQLGIFAAPVIGIGWMPLWAADVILGILAAVLANLGYSKLDVVKTFLELIKLRVPVGDPPVTTDTAASVTATLAPPGQKPVGS